MATPHSRLSSTRLASNLLALQLWSADRFCGSRRFDFSDRASGKFTGLPQGSGREALRHAKFARVLRYIDSHLAEPDLLTPRSVSEKLGMSLRSLHLLFEIKGVSFGRWVTRRRLTEIKSLLASPATADRSIADIASRGAVEQVRVNRRAKRRSSSLSAKWRAPLLGRPEQTESSQLRPHRFDGEAVAQAICRLTIPPFPALRFFPYTKELAVVCPAFHGRRSKRK